MTVSNPAIRAGFDAFIGNLGLTERTGWADRGFIPPADAVSVRLSLLPSTKTFSSGNLYGPVDARGVFIAEVWGPVGQELACDTLAATIESALLTTGGSINGIWLDGATALEGRPVDGAWRVIVRAGWRVLA